MSLSNPSPLSPPPVSSRLSQDGLPPRLTARGMLIQTWAMLIDAYRDLNSKKLFWITMILSGLVVAVFGAVGYDEKGFSILWKHFPSQFLNTTFIPKAQLYQNLYVTLGIQIWLAFIAIILALISTAPMFPDFLSGGAVDLYLARPLGRARLFITKYMVGLLFVALQVAVFSFASFLVIGIRGGVWVPGLFLAVPVVVLMFSYLWSICALIGLLTRSTIAAVLLTILAWGGIAAIHNAESALLMFSVGSKVQGQELDKNIQRIEAEIATFQASADAAVPGSFANSHIASLTTALDLNRTARAEVSDPFAVWHSIAYAVKWSLPKTAETTALLERWLNRQFQISQTEPEESKIKETTDFSFFGNMHVQMLTAIEVDKIIRSRSAVWVIGTSLLFEAAVLGLATWVFARRDF